MSKTKTILLCISFFLILTTGIIFKQDFLTILPLFVSLFVMVLQSNINRYGFLIGAANCILYSIVYYNLKLYGSLASTIFISLPFQVMTFFSWKKNKYRKSAVKFKKMSTKTRIVCTIIFVVLWAITFAVFSCFGAKFLLLDNTLFLLSLLNSILVMLAFIESYYIGCAVTFITVFLNIQIFMSNVSYITYVISALFSFYCTITGFINSRKLYKEQQNTTEHSVKELFYE